MAKESMLTAPYCAWLRHSSNAFSNLSGLYATLNFSVSFY